MMAPQEALAMTIERKPRIALLAAAESTPSVVFGLYDVLTAAGAVYDDPVSAMTGYLPKDYVHALRIEEAKQAIETGDGNLDEIGAQVGYEDATFFRRLFKRRVGLTPAAYRRKFSKVVAVH
jgi:methylphosphotriester-DNA--protein-cysteine methyltransferase